MTAGERADLRATLRQAETAGTIRCLDRFAEKIEKSASGCWQWRGYIQYKGYGQFWNGERLQLAHRFAYEAFVGPIPEGLELDHLCRNRGCVNPTHLEAVTPRENQRRGEAGIANSARATTRTHCPSGHPFDEVNTYRVPSSGHRQCRICRAAANTRYQRQRVSA